MRPPGRGDFSISNFHPGPIPGNLGETIFGVRKVARAEGGWPVFGLPPLKKCRRRDRDHLVPPRRMDAAVCRAEVCYPASILLGETRCGRKHGRHRVVERREWRFWAARSPRGRSGPCLNMAADDRPTGRVTTSPAPAGRLHAGTFVLASACAA